MIQQIKTFLSKDNCAAWCLFLLFAISIFLKGVIFHWSCFHSILLSSLWHHPLEFVRFWGGKLIPALFLGSFVFIIRNRIWTICVHILADIWLIANIFYYNANTLFLSYETMKMADNMGGFWDSLLAYTEWHMILYPIITIVYVACLFMISKSPKSLPIAFYLTMLLSLSISIFDNLCFKICNHSRVSKNEATEQVMSSMLSDEEFVFFYPFGHVYYYATIGYCWDYNVWASDYVKNYSIYSYLPACFIYSILSPAGEIIELTDNDNEQIKEFIVGYVNQNLHTPQNNLVFVLFESLESWPINDVCGYNFMPNLQTLSKNEHSLYCDKLKSQVRHGNSADGQMIDITGLLPISNGATCMLYKYNIFPSYAQCYPYSAIVNPAPGMYNQSLMTFAYQFKQLIEQKKGEDWWDKEVVDQMINYIDTVKEPFCLFGITVSSHVPFSHGCSTNPTYSIDGMPAIMLAYLNCLYYTDSIIGKLVNAVQNNERLANNTTIVISGDHTIFRREDKQIDQFTATHNINMKTAGTFTPLLIYSPNIKENIFITDTCYQMDIYPTVMHLIGCEDYYWKGFGVNLLDKNARRNRPISEQEAYRISDIIIRSDYFATHSE